MHPTSQFLAVDRVPPGPRVPRAVPHARPRPESATNALTSFRNIVDRFPGTPWASRAQLRIRECRETLARHEASSSPTSTCPARAPRGRGPPARTSSSTTRRPTPPPTRSASCGRAYDEQGEPEAAAARARDADRAAPRRSGGATTAREQLGTPDAPAIEGDPLPATARRARTTLLGTESRQRAPRTVSAYPDTGPRTGAPDVLSALRPTACRIDTELPTLGLARPGRERTYPYPEWRRARPCEATATGPTTDAGAKSDARSRRVARGR